MYSKFWYTNTKYDSCLAFKWLWQISCNFRISVGYMWLIKVKFVGAILTNTNCTEDKDLFYFSAWASRFMHFPNVVISLLMRLAYYRRFPLDSVFETRSLPAKSTTFSIPFMYLVYPPSFHLCNTVIWITAWLREDLLFLIMGCLLRLFLLSFSFWLLSWQLRIVLRLCAQKPRPDL